MIIKGNKNNKNFYLIKKLFNNKIPLYVEPFGGSFGMFHILKDLIDYSIYNDKDKETYDYYKGIANESYNNDYKDIIKKFDSKDTFFILTLLIIIRNIIIIYYLMNMKIYVRY